MPPHEAFLTLMKPRSPHHAVAHGREDREEQGWLSELEKSGCEDDANPIPMYAAASQIVHATPAAADGWSTCVVC